MARRMPKFPKGLKARIAREEKALAREIKEAEIRGEKRKDGEWREKCNEVIQKCPTKLFAEVEVVAPVAMSSTLKKSLVPVSQIYPFEPSTISNCCPFSAPLWLIDTRLRFVVNVPLNVPAPEALISYSSFPDTTKYIEGVKR